MKIKELLSINMYGQELITSDVLLERFNSLSLDEKRIYLCGLLEFIGQSKPIEEDILTSITNSELRPTFTPCVLLKKGVKYHNLIKLVDLPENELNKSLVLLLSLFKIAYTRRYLKERVTTDKWWYSDLSNAEYIKQIMNQYS